MYTAEHPALAMLETLVHLDLPYDFVPSDYVLMTIVIPDAIEATGIDHATPPKDPAVFGSRWIAARRTPVLWVPSFLLPQSYNVLINPAHPEAGQIRVESIEPLNFDPRLF